MTDSAGDRDQSVDPADAFGALSDETRVDILEALADRHRERPAAPALGFADLRKRVGVRDSGRFRYHLEELRGRFVEQTDEGYRLTYAGLEVAAAVVAGTYTDRGTAGPTELDGACPTCDESPIARYEDGVLRVGCANDHRLFEWGLPPNAIGERDVPAVVDLATAVAYQSIVLARSDTCRKCYGTMGARLVEGESAGPSGLLFEARCDSCGARLIGPAGFGLLGIPAVEQFYADHDRWLRDTRLWELPYLGSDADVTVRDDPDRRVTFGLPADGDRLSVTLDERVRVIETARESGTD